jgi:UDP-GlcNAc:undecaprenyl-phosphate GlcNAc-1-phosphate transferase
MFSGINNWFGGAMSIEAFIISGVVTALALRLLRRLALHVDHVDVAGGHKSHEGEIPLVGGLAMFIGFVSASLYGFSTDFMTHAPLYSGALILLVVGVLDDRCHLAVRVRLVAQVLAVLLMIFWGGKGVFDLGSMFYGELALSGWLMVLVTVFAGAGGINAFNMQDGADGLAGSLALVTVASLIVLAGVAGNTAAMQPLLILGGALLAFLFFNAPAPWRKRATVFMGDAGSLFIGFLLVWYMTDLSQGEQRVMTPVTALWIFAMPLFDAVYTILRRLLSGRAMFAPDRGHFHHLLQARGMTTGQAVGMIAALAIAMAGLGIAGYLYAIPEWGMFYSFVGVFVVYSLLVTRLWRGAEDAHWFLTAPHCYNER